MEKIKHSYELSAWELYPNEVKIATIGADTMSSPIRAFEPILIRNVNGTVDFSFKMCAKYFDEELKEFVDNPFIPLLMTERFLKLKYKDKWYDLIIKNRQENSDQKTYTYNAKSQHINELSKTGFELEFKTELENNQGTVTELAEKILDGTDWEVIKNNPIRAFNDEQLILCTSNKEFSAVTMTEEKETINFSGNPYFYLFYPDWINFSEGKSEEVQLLYIPKCTTERLEDYILEEELFDSNGVITIENLKGEIIAKNLLATSSDIGLSKVQVSRYRGRRLVKQQKTKYNPVLERYVGMYTYQDNNIEKKAEGYTKTEFLTPTFVQNLIVNSKDFTSTSGWYGKDGKVSVDLDVYPPIDYRGGETEITRTSRIKFTTTEAKQIVYNTAIRSNVTKISEIKPKEQYILRYKFDNKSVDINNLINFQFSENNIVIDSSAISFDTPQESGDGYYEQFITFNKAFSKKELQDLRLEMVFAESGTYYLQEMQLFKKVMGRKQIKGDSGPSYSEDEEILYPGDIPFSETIETKFFYDAEANADIKDPQRYIYLSSENTYTPVYNDDTYEKITSIEKSESNRFNLIQELCESFECWADFIIEHDETGKITSKKIEFKEYIGNVKWAGFKYGINLKSIQRTVDSNQIVTKTIVKSNSNEHGKNGFCTIERATDNPTGQSYILNFDYYLNQGLLKRDTLNKDLYEDFETKDEADGGFYKMIHEKSAERDRLIASRLSDSSAFLEGMAQLTTANETYRAAYEQLEGLIAEYEKYTNLKYPEIPESSYKITVVEEPDGEGEPETIKELADNKIVEYFTKIEAISQVVLSAEADKAKYDQYTDENYNILMQDYEDKIAALEIDELNEQFFNKYKNFIQEGTWNSEEYWDDNLYYIDALDVSRTSSKPQITYTINVIDVSVFEDYAGYEVDIGDKTFVEDTEFFGYTQFVGNNNIVYKKPYREEIVVTEIREYLDEPDKNQIKVQNYKTQFDDLFQRITASIQQLQYASGGYNRASAAFNNDGTLDGDIIQNTLLSYAFTLLNPDNESVIWDADGIKVVDRQDTRKILRLSGGELAISDNGGETWITAIDANGIHIDLVTSGLINTDKIMIGNSSNYSFRWDNLGLNAYTADETNGGYNYGKFVRFDQNGLYGYSKGQYFKPENLDEVKQNADFGLTWDGFFLKSKHDDPNDKGYIEIDSENDFQVYGSKEDLRVKIGLIEVKEETTTNEAGETETVITDRIYGLRLYDENGNSVVDTDSKGNISITGTIKATSGNIGNWQIVNGNITSAQTETEYGTQGIVLDATNSQIYSAQYKTSLGMDGWSINNDEAIFNNITLRGALKCAVLEYGEVQAVGGILMIRPSTAIKDYKFIDSEDDKETYYKKTFQEGEAVYTEFDSSDLKSVYLQLEVENPFYFRTDDWIKITSEADGDIVQKDENGNDILYTGINTNLFKCAGVYYVDREVEAFDENGKPILDDDNNPTYNTVKKPIVLLDLETGEDNSNTVIDRLKHLNLKGMGLVDLGQPTHTIVEDGVEKQVTSVGISLNSSENHAMVPETSFSMFTLEERRSSNDGTWKYLQPHIILGKIPDEEIYKDIRGKYGLYADAAYITGHIRAKSLIVGFNDEDENSGKDLIGDDGYINPDTISGLQDHLDSLQNQIDGVIDTWYFADEPTLENFPATEWPTDKEKDRHLGDLYYNTDTGFSYRFAYTEEENDNGEKVKVYYWIELKDNEITAALKQIAETNAALDSKVSTFMAADVDAGNNYLSKAQEGDLLFTNDGKIYIAVKVTVNEEEKLAWREQVSSAQPTEDTKYYYAYSTDGIKIPGSWTEFDPEDLEGDEIDPSPGNYLWIKTVTIYSNGIEVPSYSVSYQGEDGETKQGKYVVTITTEYITVDSIDTVPTEDDQRWTDNVPNTYDPNNKYYFRYKYTWSDGDTTYSAAEEWSNPHEAEYWFKRGSVLEFGSDGSIVRKLDIGIDWTFTNNENLSESNFNNMVTNNTLDQDGPGSLVALKVDGKYYKVSSNGLMVNKNAIISGTVIASQGILGGWEIGKEENSYYLHSGIPAEQTEPSIWLHSAGKSVIIDNSEIPMVLKVGDNFGVSNNGTLYASNAKIKGEIHATTLTIGQKSDDDSGTPLEDLLQQITISGGQVFKKTVTTANNGSQNIDYAPKTIDLTATISDITKLDGIYWYYQADSGIWNYINYINVSNNKATLTIDPSSNNAYFVDGKVATIRASDAAPNNNILNLNNEKYFDIFSVYIVSDGEDGNPGAPGNDAYTIILSNENFSFQADANGNIIGTGTNGTGDQIATCSVEVYKGTEPAIIDSIIIKSGNIDDVIFANADFSDKNITITAYKDAQLGTGGTIEVEITANGITFTKQLTYSVTKDGAQGNPGDPGDPAIYAVLSNEYHAIPCYSNGAVMGTNAYEGASTTMYVYEGSADKSDDWGYTAEKNHIEGYLSSNTFTITRIEEDIGYVDITATKGEQSLTKRFTVEKNKSGTSGYYLEVSHNVIKKEGNNYTPSSISTACRTISGETATTIASTLVIEYSIDGNTFAEYSRSNDNGASFISVSGIVSEIGASGSLAMVRARLYKNESDLLIDQVTIPVISDGVKGDPGDKGDTGDSEEVVSTTTTYAKNTNPNNHPTSGWDEAVPLVYEGEYLWTKVEVTYKNSDQSGISYTVVAGKEINENLLIASTVNIPYAEEYFVNNEKKAELFNKFKTYFYKLPATTVELTNNGFSLTQETSSPEFYTASFSAKKGTNYYLSFDAISNNSLNSQIEIYIYYSNGLIEGTTKTANSSKQRLSFALSSTNITKNQEIYFGFYCSSGSAGATINNIKVEEGTTATPFTPSPRDPMYQNLLLDKSYVLKTDGNGKLTGEFAPKVTVSDPDKANNVTIKFDGDSNTYTVSYDGLIVTDNLVAKGTIIASQGFIGGWGITPSTLEYRQDYTTANGQTKDLVTSYIRGIGTDETAENYQVGSRSGKDWAIWFGDLAIPYAPDSTDIRLGHFGVTKNGALYAEDAVISGNITANEGRIGELYIKKGLTGEELFNNTILSSQDERFIISPDGFDFDGFVLNLAIFEHNIISTIKAYSPIVEYQGAFDFPDETWYNSSKGGIQNSPSIFGDSANVGSNFISNRITLDDAGSDKGKFGDLCYYTNVDYSVGKGEDYLNSPVYYVGQPLIDTPSWTSKTYYFSFWAKIASGSDTASSVSVYANYSKSKSGFQFEGPSESTKLYLFEDETVSNMKDAPIEKTDKNTAGAWTFFKFQVTIPSGVKYVCFRIDNNGSQSSSSSKKMAILFNQLALSKYSSNYRAPKVLLGYSKNQQNFIDQSYFYCDIIGTNQVSADTIRVASLETTKANDE